MSNANFTSVRYPGKTALRWLVAACGWLMISVNAGIMARAEDKPEAPRVALASPFALGKGAITKVVVRGWKLDRDIVAKSGSDQVAIKVTRHDKAPVPNGQDAKQIGDTLVEIEVSVPEGFPDARLPITLIADGLESSPYSLLIGGADPVIGEAEPNDSFKQAQALAVPQIVDGQIHVDRNVDVFSVNVASEHKLMVQVIARQQGSCLDSFVTIFDGKGRKLIASDDVDGTDSRVEKTLPPGKYFIVVQDAHDRGGPAHPYRLIVQ